MLHAISHLRRRRQCSHSPPGEPQISLSIRSVSPTPSHHYVHKVKSHTLLVSITSTFTITFITAWFRVPSAGLGFPGSARVTAVVLMWMLALQCNVKCTTGERRYGTAFEGTRVRRCQACLEKITTSQITWHVRPQPPEEGVRPGVSLQGWADCLCPMLVFILCSKEGTTSF